MSAYSFCINTYSPLKTQLADNMETRTVQYYDNFILLRLELYLEHAAPASAVYVPVVLFHSLLQALVESNWENAQKVHSIRR